MLSLLSEHLLDSLRFETDPRAIHAYLSYLLPSFPVRISLSLSKLLQTRQYVSANLLRSPELYSLFLRAFTSALAAQPSELQNILEGCVTLLAFHPPPHLCEDALQMRADLESFTFSRSSHHAQEHSAIISHLRHAGDSPAHDAHLSE